MIAWDNPSTFHVGQGSEQLTTPVTLPVVLQLGILGHVAIDTIASKDLEITSLGGPPCYAGLAARRVGGEVTLVTKVGADFPDEYSVWLARSQLGFSNGAKSPNHRTTRFRIHLKGNGRTLQLTSRCIDLETTQLENLKLEGAILSPIVGEIPKSVSKSVLSQDIPTFLDPQGYLRRFDRNGFCVLSRISPRSLPKATIIKVDPEEGILLTGKSNLDEIASKLRNHGFEKVIVTNGSKNVVVSSKEVSAKILIPKVGKVVDVTGLGDILAGSFMASLLETDDFLWSVCVGVAFASAASIGRGIAKVSTVGDWEDLAQKIMDKAARS